MYVTRELRMIRLKMWKGATLRGKKQRGRGPTEADGSYVSALPGGILSRTYVLSEINQIKYEQHRQGHCRYHFFEIIQGLQEP